MKKVIILLVILFSNTLLFAQWGPKIKLNFENEVEQTAKLFFGVDTFATDGWDKDIIFHYKDTTLTEDVDLPPPPPQSMYCRLIRDTTPGSVSYSYVDFRGIPDDDTIFYHRYIVSIVWSNMTINQHININWETLPDGIDSAKFHCYQWLDDDSVVNMRKENSVLLDNSAYKLCYIYVWYNKNHTDVCENNLDMLLFPNPANDYITFYNEDYNNYSIINSAGNELMNGNLELNSDNIINIQNIPIGKYSILVNKKEKYINIPFIKK